MTPIPIPDAGDYNLFRYCHNDPIDFTDPMGTAEQYHALLLQAQPMTIAERISLWQKSMESSIGGERAFGMLQVAQNSRSLTPGEVKLGQSKYGNAINYNKVSVFHRPYIPFGRSMSPNGNMYYPGIEYSPDFSREKTALQSKFIHELMHVFQVQKLGYGLANMALAHLFHGQYKYLPVKNPGRSFFSYGIEQQAMIMQDYFRLEHGFGPMEDSGPAETQPPLSWYQNISPFGH